MKARSVPAGRVALTAAFVVLALALVPVALAGKPSAGGGGGGGKGGGGGGGTTSGGTSLNLVLVSDANGNGLPNWGDTVTFNVSTTASYPSVQVECYQGGALELDQSAGFFPSYMWSKNFTLATTQWTSGGASCTAYLEATAKNGSSSILSTLNFSVGA